MGLQLSLREQQRLESVLSRKIKDVATTGNVIDYVIKDVKRLVDKLN